MADYSLSVPEGTTEIYAGSFKNTANFPGATWETRTDAQAGLSTSELDSFVADSSTGFLMRDGYQVRAWGSFSGTSNSWASATKPIFALLVGFAIDDGEIASINETLNTHPDLNYSWQGSDANITWAHIFNMESGYSFDSVTPGIEFAYNDYGVQLGLDALQQVYSPSTLESVLNSKLSALQFQDGQIFDETTMRANISARDFARLAWFVANKGYWDGTQILPVSFFDTFMVAQVAADQTISGTETVNDYLSLGTYGGGNNQFAYGPNIYGGGLWHNNLVAQTANLCWPDGPADLITFSGHFGGETVAFSRASSIVAAYVGGVDDSFVPGTLTGENVTMGYLKDMVL